MASITIRNLDPATKEALRLRAAANNRSMEEEARVIFGALTKPSGAATPSIPLVPVAAQDHIGSGVLAEKRILLIIGGGIAAYKCLDLVRRLRERGATVRCVMTRAAEEFITPLSVGALTADTVFTDLFDRQDEHDVGHIRLAREADLIVIAPATADLMAKMAHGLANDLASTVLMAATAPALVAPAMNPAMWDHPATRRNQTTLAGDGLHFIGPNAGEMAESGEAGFGRMAEPLEIVAAVERLLDHRPKPLAGKTVIVTSGPTHEPIDPVRYIANRSSGKQGHAIASALAELGATVRLVTGPVAIADPAGVDMVRVESAREMHDAVHQLLPADVAIFAAAVADYRPATEASDKIKKREGGIETVALTENPDILAKVGTHETGRPRLVIGFAAETRDLVANAQAKLARKGADYIVANDVSHDSGIGGAGGVMGGDRNRITLVSKGDAERWPEMDKSEVAERIAALVAEQLETVTV
ncbi:MAG: bifunctional phosphopantothenoylcysteine decarboxylase/phosphopantothenate--cysteine ligase CoaBC [Roseitalea sp.]|jgi:phosphopantothenoylcysteine decarboxylase/phosphopantothenate--cysteine ligase|nr:bifunctional phosphopantothenoylcysteine decarboxylase/phosphopantothenate--cysteine ligase CoaBC [Roseitalea sp.]MBO6721942.1 bifunctional phosphopantothenoylcysteine decarboxylase/phosphopantothenate--cysteine ligase CoaBC [Roseitalea sp.]MBO6743113.1 bifunctional phosphopantothenoylcysteine decarboxylase/phosphopantothenate--cysteine ligase CoaBC [Roseitalea sp.]